MSENKYPIVTNAHSDDKLDELQICLIEHIKKKGGIPLGKPPLLFLSCYRELNSGPHPYQGCALPLSYSSEIGCKGMLLL